MKRFLASIIVVAMVAGAALPMAGQVFGSSKPETAAAAETAPADNGTEQVGFEEAISQLYWKGGFPSQENPRGPVQRPVQAQVIRFSLCLWLGSILCLSVLIC